jgi:hypothetical protein
VTWNAAEETTGALGGAFLRDRVQAVILVYETGVIRTGSAKLPQVA